MEKLLAHAQIGLAAFNFLAITSLTFVILLDPGDFSEPKMQLLQLLVAQLVAVLIMQANYFYQRQRPQTPTDRQRSE